MPRVIKDIHLHIFWGHFGEGLYKAVKSKRVVRETRVSRSRRRPAWWHNRLQRFWQFNLISIRSISQNQQSKALVADGSRQQCRLP